jgi:hypothetical protein
MSLTSIFAPALIVTFFALFALTAFAFITSIATATTLINALYNISKYWLWLLIELK